MTTGRINQVTVVRPRRRRGRRRGPHGSRHETGSPRVCKSLTKMKKSLQILRCATSGQRRLGGFEAPSAASESGRRAVRQSTGTAKQQEHSLHVKRCNLQQNGRRPPSHRVRQFRDKPSVRRRRLRHRPRQAGRRAMPPGRSDWQHPTKKPVGHTSERRRDALTSQLHNIA